MTVLGEDAVICGVCGRMHEVGCECPGVRVGDHTVVASPIFVAPATATEIKAVPAAHRAIRHLLSRVQRDPRLAFYIGPHTESLNLLLAAGAEIAGQDPATFAAEFLKQPWATERPRCSSCECSDCNPDRHDTEPEVGA